MKKTLLLFFSILSCMCVYADHLQGGYVRCYYNGSSYTIDLEMYRDCMGIPFGPVDYVTVSSASLGINSYMTLPLVSKDTVNPVCSTISTCQSFSAIYPGWEIYKFSTTVMLPPANDWVISYSAAVRNMAIKNINASSGIYIEAKLDNTAINSNAQWAGKVNYYLIENTAMSVPLQVIDADGDSVDVRLIAPREYTSTTNISYQPGYSVTNPFGGGYCTINPTTHTLDMLAPAPGVYTLAFAIDEYRNGVQIGTSTKDVEMFVFPSGTTPYTLPTPAPVTHFNFDVCPGQTNTVTLIFDDIITDSVFVSIIAPTISGWSFSSSSVAGLGTGSVTLTYSAPAGLDPTVTPYISIPVHVKDNACPMASADYTIVINTQACGADSVWPGDANSDNIVNLLDPLYVALAWGNTGASRPGASTTWIGQACANWPTSFPLSGVNHKHADCDGDGIVDANDFAPIATNYGNVHMRIDGSNSGTPLKFDLSGIYFGAGSTVSIPIKLGDVANKVNNLLGIATRISINGINLNSPASISNSISWIGNSANTYNFTKEVNNNTIDWAQARIDQTEQDGDGTIGMLNFTIPVNTPFGTMVTLNFTLTHLIDAHGNILPQVSEESATVMVVWPTTVTNVNESIQNAVVVPNPSGNNASLYLGLQYDANVVIDIVDVTGRKVWHNQQDLTQGERYISLPADDLNPGLYLIQVSSDGKKYTQQLKWNRL